MRVGCAQSPLSCSAAEYARLAVPSFRRRSSGMHVFSLEREQQWDPRHHVEKILGKIADGDVTVACWEPGQVSPYHCHPHATEIYFCFEGGGTMKTPGETVPVTPGSFVVHPPGELHEWITGPARTPVSYTH